MLIDSKKLNVPKDLVLSELLICGVDEAGRGPLVGSVVAAAVILDPNKPISGLRDSKKLSSKSREILFDQIIHSSLAWAIAEASCTEIDQLNILQATMLAMRRAVDGLSHKGGRLPDKAIIDGNRVPELSIPSEAIVKGDSKEPAISAASILAKVTRDRQMEKLHQKHPEYGFNIHMGYPTVKHLISIKEFGICDSHRKTFGPIKRILDGIK